MWKDFIEKGVIEILIYKHIFMNKHLHNSLRALFLSLAVLLSLPMLAVEVEIDGINYNLNAEAKQATVIEKSSGKYSGHIAIPETVEYEGAFYSVTRIGSRTFYRCSGLTSVAIPKSVTSMAEGAFSFSPPYQPRKFASVHISDIATWCNIKFEGNLTSNPLSYAHHLYLNGEEVKDLVIPNTVTSIARAAFYGCSGLTSVTIPNSVTSIGEVAFQGCSGMTQITIPKSVMVIESGAFVACFGLTSVTIPNSVKEIKHQTFASCSALSSVIIPNSVTGIGYWAFQDCRSLRDVYCHAKIVPTAYRSDVFEFSPIADATLHVPAASVDSYKATAPWSGFGKIVALTEDETGIDELKGENGKVKTALYDLSGRRVQKGQKGIFIRDGKVMVR